MPEGHTVHRTAKRFRQLFLNQKLKVSSPQGRFTDAKKVTSSRLTEAMAHGKQLFLVFENDLYIRIHLGIYGKWSFFDFEGPKPPSPVGQVRARFLGQGTGADLRGPTACELMDFSGVKKVISGLGPDPLVVDSNGSEALRFVNRVRSSGSPIAGLLMNQSVISGIGNVYRAELLFRAGLNPYTAGNQIPESQLLLLWDDAVRLMKIGVKRGVMLTRDDFLTGKVLAEDRHFVYKREGLQCRVCGKKIKLEEFLGRKLYFCPQCQR